MRTVGRIGPTLEAISVWTRSRGTPAAARARYRSRKVPVDTRLLYCYGATVLLLRGAQVAGPQTGSGGTVASRSLVNWGRLARAPFTLTCWRRPAADSARPRSAG